MWNRLPRIKKDYFFNRDVGGIVRSWDVHYEADAIRRYREAKSGRFDHLNHGVSLLDPSGKLPQVKPVP